MATMDSERDGKREWAKEMKRERMFVVNKLITHCLININWKLLLLSVWIAIVVVVLQCLCSCYDINNKMHSVCEFSREITQLRHSNHRFTWRSTHKPTHQHIQSTRVEETEINELNLCKVHSFWIYILIISIGRISFRQSNFFEQGQWAILDLNVTFPQIKSIMNCSQCINCNLWSTENPNSTKTIHVKPNQFHVHV